MFVSTALIAHQFISKTSTLRKDMKKHQNEKQYIKLLVNLALYFLVTNFTSNIWGVVYCLIALYGADLSFYSTDTYIYINMALSFSYYAYISCDVFLYFFCNTIFRTQLLSIFHIQIQKQKKTPEVSSTTQKKSTIFSNISSNN